MLGGVRFEWNLLYLDDIFDEASEVEFFEKSISFGFLISFHVPMCVCACLLYECVKCKAQLFTENSIE